MGNLSIDEADFSQTGYSYTLSLIQGKHKMVILYCLMEYEWGLAMLGFSAQLSDLGFLSHF